MLKLGGEGNFYMILPRLLRLKHKFFFRLIRGGGEIVEEIVSKERSNCLFKFNSKKNFADLLSVIKYFLRHQAINRDATAADGNFFQNQSLSRARSMYD